MTLKCSNLLGDSEDAKSSFIYASLWWPEPSPGVTLCHMEANRFLVSWLHSSCRPKFQVTVRGLGRSFSFEIQLWFSKIFDVTFGMTSMQATWLCDDLGAWVGQPEGEKILSQPATVIFESSVTQLHFDTGNEMGMTRFGGIWIRNKRGKQLFMQTLVCIQMYFDTMLMIHTNCSTLHDVCHTSWFRNPLLVSGNLCTRRFLCQFVPVLLTFFHSKEFWSPKFLFDSRHMSRPSHLWLWMLLEIRWSKAQTQEVDVEQFRFNRFKRLKRLRAPVWHKRKLSFMWEDQVPLWSMCILPRVFLAVFQKLQNCRSFGRRNGRWTRANYWRLRPLSNALPATEQAPWMEGFVGTCTLTVQLERCIIYWLLMA